MTTEYQESLKQALQGVQTLQIKLYTHTQLDVNEMRVLIAMLVNTLCLADLLKSRTIYLSAADCIRSIKEGRMVIPHIDGLLMAYSIWLEDASPSIVAKSQTHTAQFIRQYI